MFSKRNSTVKQYTRTITLLIGLTVCGCDATTSSPSKSNDKTSPMMATVDLRTLETFSFDGTEFIEKRIPKDLETYTIDISILSNADTAPESYSETTPYMPFSFGEVSMFQGPSSYSYFLQKNQVTLNGGYPNDWTRVTIVNDGKATKLYVNGALKTDTQTSAPLLAENKLTIGKGFNQRYWAGKIRLFDIYETAAPINEIKKYQKRLSGERVVQLDPPKSPAPVGSTEVATNQTRRTDIPLDVDLHESEFMIADEADPNRISVNLQYNELKLDAATQANGDYRSFYGLTHVSGAQNVTKAVGGSFYLEDHGEGDIETAYGGTSQYLAKSGGATSSAIGMLSTVRHDDPEAAIKLGRGANNIAWSIAPSGKAYHDAVATESSVLNEGGADIDTAFGAVNEVSNSGTGHIDSAVGLKSVIRNQSNIRSANGIQTKLENTGNIERWAAISILPNTGVVAEKSSFAIASEDMSQSYFLGRVAVGNTGYSAAQLAISGKKEEPAIAIIEGETAFSFTSSMVDEERNCIRILLDGKPSCLAILND